MPSSKVGIPRRSREVEVFKEFFPGITDGEGCTHLILLPWLDRADRN